MLEISVPLASLGACRAGAASFTEAVFTLNRLFCRYWPPTPATAAIAAAAPLAARNLRRLVLGGVDEGAPRGISVRVMLSIQGRKQAAACPRGPARSTRLCPRSRRLSTGSRRWRGFLAW